MGAGALVLRGEPGVGKTALLEYAIESASEFRVARALGVERKISVVIIEHRGEKRPCRSADDRRGIECPPSLGVEHGQVDAGQLVDDGAGSE